MNVKNKAFFLVSLVILLLSAFLLREGILHFNEEIDFEIQEQERIIDGVTSEVLTDLYDPYLFKIKFFATENKQIIEAFANKEREQLLKLCLPQYDLLHGENKFFHALDFNLPDGTVFLRVQKPELFGDNIGESRPIVAAVHKEQKQLSGFDIGKHGAIFWVAQPIFHESQYLGAVEFGIEVKQLENALGAILGKEVTSVLHANNWQKAKLIQHGFQEHGEYVLMTRGTSLFDQIPKQLDFNEDDQWLDIDGKQHILHSCAHLSNYDSKEIGKLILFQDISTYVQKKKDFVTHALLLCLVALIVASFVLYYSISGIVGRLEEFARENKQAKDELQRAHDTLEDRVKERTVELAQSNVRLEDEVTIRRRTEAKLDEQRKFLMILIESLAHPLYVIDADTYEIILANQAACAITGSDSYHGMTCYSMTHHRPDPCGGEEHPCPLAEIKKTKKPVMVEHIHLDQDNIPRYFEIHAYPMFDMDNNVSHIIEYNIDITEKKNADDEKEELRAQLLASQKMEAVGVLAGGIAHDFNNLLTTILGYSQIMAMKLTEENPMRDMIEEIYDAAERGSNLTGQLLAFSRKQVMEMKVINLNVIVENISKMLGRLIGEDISMTVELSANVGNVKVDIGQIEQVIMNLVVNARDAMPEGGELKIKTDQLELEERYTAVHHGVEPGMYTVISVTDTGKGMSQETQEKIFEPFYTTKKRGKGTGLGLATAYGIIRQHKGHVYVYSEEGKGSTFKIYLPLVESAATKIVAKKVNKSMPTGSETILIVDDDDAIRRLIRDTLEPLGYSLIEAGSGEDALALIERNPQDIDLTLTDLIMPGINGQELIKEVQKKHPQLKAILMSGYTDDIIARQGGIEEGINFINKPLLPISLANKIRDVLDSE